MKLVMPCLVAALLLAVPAAAQADGPPIVPPYGATVCDTAGTCMTTTEHGDSWARGQYLDAVVVQRPDGGYQLDTAGCGMLNALGLHPSQVNPALCSYVYAKAASWTAQRFHAYRRATPYFDAILWRVYPTRDGAPVLTGYAPDVLTSKPELNTADCNASGENGKWIVPWGPGPAGFGASEAAPEDFVLACGLPRAGSTSPPPAKPAKPQTCAAIVVAKKRVNVTSTSHACASARTILARYMRSGTKTSGWSCSKTAIGRTRTTTCSAATAKKIVGRWRV